ncbi:hypothetical protein Taro_000012 [Colocasia esculenta]|uniref:Uncharacterized protein n=1 Tax=Colocasia esculenta TaxID=4460 RepID=A0A843TDZ4_COLES|nr:hypothetical protein [Colocasia esculenta]
MGMHATKDRVESDTSTIYSIFLVLPVGCWNDASRASIQKDKGTEVTNSPSHLGRKTNRHLDVIQPFPFLLGKNGEVHPNRPMKK